MNLPKKPAGNTASKTKKKHRKSKEELNAEGRERKNEKKHRGNKSGARYQDNSTNSKNDNQNQVADPRLGSKKPVPLIVEDNKAVATRPAKPKAPEAKVKLSPEQELTMLEQDDRLDSLLARLEDGETITEQEQEYIDNCLDRIDELMTILGIELVEEEEEDEEKLDDIMRILKSK